MVWRENGLGWGNTHVDGGNDAGSTSDFEMASWKNEYYDPATRIVKTTSYIVMQSSDERRVYQTKEERPVLPSDFVTSK